MYGFALPRVCGRSERPPVHERAKRGSRGSVRPVLYEIKKGAGLNLEERVASRDKKEESEEARRPQQMDRVV